MWRSLVTSLNADDLFIRVVLFASGGFTVACGVYLATAVLAPAAVEWWILAGAVLGLLLLSYGVLLIGASFARPDSAWGKKAVAWYPDPTANEALLVVAVVLLLPLAALTLLLKACGVRGYVP
jgi:hypothetical protein